jgi:hypothetical protein
MRLVVAASPIMLVTRLAQALPVREILVASCPLAEIRPSIQDSESTQWRYSNSAKVDEHQSANWGQQRAYEWNSMNILNNWTMRGRRRIQG